jgi:hypothetical protein
LDSKANYAKRELTVAITVDEIEALRPTFYGSWQLGNGITRPVYMGLRHLKYGDLLYRGCTADTEDVAKVMLSEARFFSITESGTTTYSRPKFGDPPGLTGFCMFLTVKEPVILANVSLSPLVARASPKGSPPEWQRRYATKIVSHLIGEAVDGIWDLDGEEVLIEDPVEKLLLRKIRPPLNPAAPERHRQQG